MLTDDMIGGFWVIYFLSRSADQDITLSVLRFKHEILYQAKPYGLLG